MKKAEAYVEDAACDAASDELFGLPVCRIIKLLYDSTSDFWDVSQNTPSMLSGSRTLSFPDRGLGGNVNTVVV